MKVDIQGAVAIVRLADEPGWDWSVGAVEQFCAAAGWEIVERVGPGSAFFRTNLRVGRPEANVHGNPRRANLISAYVTDVCEIDLPGTSEWLAEAFDQLSVAFTGVLGECSRHEPGRKAKVFWDKPNMTIGLSMTWRSIFVRLVRPDGFFGIDYQE